MPGFQSEWWYGGALSYGRKSEMKYSRCMDPIGLTRRLVDIESITGNEAAVGVCLLRELAALGFEVRKMPVPFPPDVPAEGRERFNVYASIAGQRPDVVFSTHMDTVPPFIPST